MALAGFSDKTIRYSIARLGAGYLTSGHHGTFFAIETGAINGVHRGTVFGFTQAEKPKSRELIEAIGWARWIRPVVRRHERESVGRPSDRQSAAIAKATARSREHRFSAACEYQAVDPPR